MFPSRHSLSPNRRTGTGLALALAGALAALVTAAPAAAKGTQACTFPSEKPPANVYAQPNDKAKVIGVLKGGDHFEFMLRVRDRNGFSQMRWYPDDAKKKRLTGWVRPLDVHGGECED